IDLATSICSSFSRALSLPILSLFPFPAGFVETARAQTDLYRGFQIPTSLSPPKSHADRNGTVHFFVPAAGAPVERPLYRVLIFPPPSPSPFSPPGSDKNQSNQLHRTQKSFNSLSFVIRNLSRAFRTLKLFQNSSKTVPTCLQVNRITFR